MSQDKQRYPRSGKIPDNGFTCTSMKCEARLYLLFYHNSIRKSSKTSRSPGTADTEIFPRGGESMAEHTTADYRTVADSGGTRYRFYCQVSGAFACATKPYPGEDAEAELRDAWESRAKTTSTFVTDAEGGWWMRCTTRRCSSVPTAPPLSMRRGIASPAAKGWMRMCDFARSARAGSITKGVRHYDGEGQVGTA